MNTLGRQVVLPGFRDGPAHLEPRFFNSEVHQSASVPPRRPATPRRPRVSLRRARGRALDQRRAVPTERRRGETDLRRVRLGRHRVFGVEKAFLRQRLSVRHVRIPRPREGRKRHPKFNR